MIEVLAISFMVIVVSKIFFVPRIIPKRRHFSSAGFATLSLCAYTLEKLQWLENLSDWELERFLLKKITEASTLIVNMPESFMLKQSLLFLEQA